MEFERLTVGKAVGLALVVVAFFWFYFGDWKLHCTGSPASVAECQAKMKAAAP